MLYRDLYHPGMIPGYFYTDGAIPDLDLELTDHTLFTRLAQHLIPLLGPSYNSNVTGFHLESNPASDVRER